MTIAYAHPALEDLERVPAELTARRQWVLWRAEPPRTPGEKPVKMPYSIHGGRASSTDPATWGDFGAVVDAYEVGEAWNGIGYAFSNDDPFVGIDLDDCRCPETGEVADEARAIIERLGNCYAEVSPSGTGIKAWVRGTKPAGWPCKRKARTFGWIEVYEVGRYFAVTGRVYAP